MYLLAGSCFHAKASFSRLTSKRFLSDAVNWAKQYKAGQKLHGYTVNKAVSIPELHVTAIVLSHDKTNAQHLHLAREDSNNVFGVVFRTTPMDDTGVPHILEHTALCGSARYPVRDPFFKMLNRSLSTFMNAFTASDWTMYPFSTQNAQDYENLLSVYLDAAFFPKLLETDFRQEGWRLEHEDIQDATTPMCFKGIVFNEMKGAFSNSQSLFVEKCSRLLLPSHTYGVCSGGDPLAIPTLKWQQLRDFQKSHYHPSNSRFITYGDIPLERHLELIDQQALSKFSQILPETAVPSEPRWTSPVTAEMHCAPDPMAAEVDNQTTVAVIYALGDITDLFESFTLGILGSLLVNGEKSPFYKSLREANIGSDFSPTLGFDAQHKDTVFSVGLQGIKHEDVEKVTQIIEETFDKVIRDGFEQKQIEAILHEIELGLKHQSAGFGLNLAMAVVPVWIHDGDPTEQLRVNAQVNRFKVAMAENPGLLQDKVQQYFKANQHKLTLVMKPDESYEQKRQEAENALLKSTIAELSDEQRQEVYTKGLSLAELQMKEEDLSSLPTLKISDIKQETEQIHAETIHEGSVPIQLCLQPTNGVTYFNAISDIATLSCDLEPYVPIFCNIVTKMGAGDLDFRELSERIYLTTGGLQVSPHVNSHHTNEQLYEKGILFSSHCLDRNVDAMFDLWKEIFLRLNLSDTNQLKTLIMMAAAEMANSLSDAGHKYVIVHSAASLSPARQATERMSGITQVCVMKEIAEMTDLSPVVEKLQRIANHLLTSSRFRCSLNATSDAMDSAAGSLQQFVADLPQPSEQNVIDSFYTQDVNFEAISSEMHFELPFQVNCISRSVKTVPFAHSDFASLRILASLMSAKFLHREIREKGGAYGGGAVGRMSGVFSFFSYRDPNSLKTLDAYDNAVDWASSGVFTQAHIDEAKLPVFSQVDMPIPPGSKGFDKFANGIDDTMRHYHRQQLFAVSKEDLIRVSQQYLSKDNRLSSVTLLGPENTQTTDWQQWTIKKYA